MDGDEIDAVFGMGAHNAHEVVDGDVGKIFFQIADGVVHGHRADHGRRFLDEAFAERVRFAAVGKVHDGMRAVAKRDVDLFPLHGRVGDIARNAQVDVDFSRKPLAHALGRERRVVDVRRYGDASGRNTLANELRRAVLLGCHCFHLRGNFAATRGIELRHESPFVGITHIRFLGSGRYAPPLSPPAHTHGLPCM